LGAAVILGGAVLLGVALVTANAQADQLGDPFVGHFSKHTIRYLIVAAGALFSGGILVAFGGSGRGGAATR
jgi:hypothetical protein